MGTVPLSEQGDNIITHTICMECATKVFADVGSDLTNFLNTLGVPVILIDAQGTVCTASIQAQELLGRSMPQIQGRRGGEVFLCAYASLPGGCGNTDHCEACTIRNTVTDTYRTGASHCKTPVYVDRGAPGGTNRIGFLISTEKRGNYVVLRIDEVDGDT